MKFGLIPVNVGITAPEQIITTAHTVEQTSIILWSLVRVFPEFLSPH